MKANFIKVGWAAVLAVSVAIPSFAIPLIESLRGDSQAVQATLKKIRVQLDLYRRASSRLQEATKVQKIPYCLFNEYDPTKKTKLRIGWQTVDGARNFASGKAYLDQIALDSNGQLGRREGIQVGAAIINIFHGMIPLDTDAFRILRQTREYDRRNREKFENFAGGFLKVTEGVAAVERKITRERLQRLAGTFGFAGLDQTIGYVLRDYRGEFNGKKVLNFGTCEGASDLVLEIDRHLRTELEVIAQIVGLLNSLATEFDDGQPES